MTNYNDNYRMYGLVPYNISEIQKGIQFGHAVQEYNNIYTDGGMSIENRVAFEEWRRNSKTFIILNGGTTNDNPDSLGTLNLHEKEISKMGIQTALFHEPDLGDQLTAFVFIVPNTVYDTNVVPDFWDWIDTDEMPFSQIDTIRLRTGDLYIEDLNEEQMHFYSQWETAVGGEKYARLKFYLKQFKLA